MNLYRALVRPILFAIPAETAHSLARAALGLSFIWERVGRGSRRDPRLAVEVHGLKLANPIGLAPGFDKDCDFLASLAYLGFGFLVPGSVMGSSRPGNPKPRLARLVEQEAILNAMGLPSKGLAHAIDRLTRLRRRPVPIIVAVQGTTPDEILTNFLALQPHADAVELVLVCPNTQDTNANASLEAAADLASRVASRRQKPVFAKIPQHLRGDDGHELEDFLDICLRAGLEGVSVNGARHVETSLLSRGNGELGGRPVFADTLRLIRRIRAHAGDGLTVIASGGISTGRDALDALRAGADLIEIYSAVIYRGWDAPASIAHELADLLTAENIPSVRHLTARSHTT